MEMHSLDNTKIIPFLQALDKGDKSELGIDQDTFERLAKEYIELSKEKANNFELRLQEIEQKIFLVTTCLYVLSINIADEEMIVVLNDQGYKVTRDNYFTDIEKVLKDLKVMKFKRDNLKSKMPKKAKAKKKKEDTNIFSILTGVSTGLEMSLDFHTMVVSEFIAWRKQLDRKIKIMNKNNPKKNGK